MDDKIIHATYSRKQYYMAKEQNPVVGIRMPVAMIERIDAAVATGKYRSRGEYIMAALRLMETLESDKDLKIENSLPVERSDGRA